MIYVMLEEEDGVLWVSHGINSETLENVVLPQEKWSYFKVYCKSTPNGYVLKDGK